MNLAIWRECEVKFGHRGISFKGERRWNAQEDMVAQVGMVEMVDGGRWM